MIGLSETWQLQFDQPLGSENNLSVLKQVVLVGTDS